MKTSVGVTKASKPSVAAVMVVSYSYIGADETSFLIPGEVQ